MRNMAFSKVSQVMVMAIFLAITLLLSFEVATAGFHEAIPELKLGRRALGVLIEVDYAGYPGYPAFPDSGVGGGGFTSPPSTTTP
ncbi:hypothetical protein HHK36_030508 [Tetracentron sinense]|uniref:Uncharacterized protein n=1 Tax=Tetracentron sinense TaxID=13715 RepID=A0A834YB75_TETSI|nr:hypothetical protein HHK36_030508 [Tetracentron sinense]